VECLQIELKAIEPEGCSVEVWNGLFLMIVDETRRRRTEVEEDEAVGWVLAQKLRFDVCGRS
jgi:hypothetical protein